jgi:hypothetical protein
MWPNHLVMIQVLILFFIISGCGGITSKETNTEQANSISAAVSDHGELAEPSPTIPEDEIIFSTVPRKFDGLEELYSGPIAVRVRMAQSADLQNFGRITQTEAMTLAMGSIILVGGTFGAAALPLLGAYAAWGTIFFGGVAPGMSAFEQHRQANIAEAVAKVDFPQIAQTALQLRLNRRVAEGKAQLGPTNAIDRQVEIVLVRLVAHLLMRYLMTKLHRSKRS